MHINVIPSGIAWNLILRESPADFHVVWGWGVKDRDWRWIEVSSALKRMSSETMPHLRTKWRGSQTIATI